MKKLLYITDSEEFFRVLNEEKEKVREQLRQLPPAEKLRIASTTSKLLHRAIRRSEPEQHQAATKGDTDWKRES